MHIWQRCRDCDIVANIMADRKVSFYIEKTGSGESSASSGAGKSGSAAYAELKQKYPLMRVGVLSTPHGDIHTPAFVSVGTKSTVKGLTPEMIAETGAEGVLANTYHLYLQPGEELIKKSGGLGKFMNWSGPTMTDSGGFQAFSLGAALGRNITKLIKNGGHDGGKNEFGEIVVPEQTESTRNARSAAGDGRTDDENAFKPAKIDANGVMFRSVIDGSSHYFTPEKSIQIQNDIGADIIFAFDECTSPHEPLRYQQEAMDRTHRWAKRCLEYFYAEDDNGKKKYHGEGQALFAVVQGGRHEELRRESAKVLSEMTFTDADGIEREFDGFGIGGSFAKEDMSTAVQWVNEILPAGKPRHLLGIGEPDDLFMAIERGCDTFDCVLPTRNGRTGTIFTSTGKINITNAKYRDDMSTLDDYYLAPSLANYTKAYLCHLFHAKEMLGGMLASVHNLYFLIELTKRIRQSIIDGTYEEFKEDFLKKYKK
jgi:queuine tRNA-ribosyltransferase